MALSPTICATLAAAACIALSTCAATPDLRPAQAVTGDGPGDAVAGRALVGDLCSACHAIGHQGESPNERAPPLRTVLSRYDAEQLTEDLQQGELMGGADLPHVYLSAQGARDAVAYLVELSRERS